MKPRNLSLSDWPLRLLLRSRIDRHELSKLMLGSARRGCSCEATYLLMKRLEYCGWAEY